MWCELLSVMCEIYVTSVDKPWGASKQTQQITAKPWHVSISKKWGRGFSQCIRNHIPDSWSLKPPVKVFYASWIPPSSRMVLILDFSPCSPCQYGIVDFSTWLDLSFCLRVTFSCTLHGSIFSVQGLSSLCNFLLCSLKKKRWKTQVFDKYRYEPYVYN